MGFLNPFFLLAAAAVAVPLLLHLLRRQDSRRLPFPALRYLQRTRREHARQIRFRQLLLLLLRIAVVLLLVLAGARPHLTGGRGEHEPTALAIVLDNSMSSGLVLGEERVLDRLKALAGRSVAAATDEDRIWVIRAGEPWDIALPGDPREAERRIRETEVAATFGDLGAALDRASTLVTAAASPAAEIHLLSDLQAEAFGEGWKGAGHDAATVFFAGDWTPPDNRYLTSPLVGGGLPPLARERTGIGIQMLVAGGGEAGSEEDPEPLPARVVIDGRVRGTGEVAPGGHLLLPLGPFQAGWIRGYVETDPDALRGDDRRYFAFETAPPRRVAVAGGESFHLAQALAVLAEGNRIRMVEKSQAEVLFSLSAEGIDRRRSGVTVVIVPPADPTLLPAVNQRLRDAAIPWRYERDWGGGEVELQTGASPVELEGIRATSPYRIRRPQGGPPPEEEAPAAIGMATGDPWLVVGETAGGPYFLLASPLDPERVDLPVSASMIPLLEWLVAHRGKNSSPPADAKSGASLPLPKGATRLRLPDGTVLAVDGGRPFRETAMAGIYSIFAGDSLLGEVALNAPEEESVLTRIETKRLAEVMESSVAVEDGALWEEAIFRARLGTEIWRSLLLVALALLLLESWIAASGGERAAREPEEFRKTTPPASASPE